jgi:hypothetical protein
MADEIRKENFHYADGKMKLEQFYSGLALNREQQSDDDYKTHLDDLRLWIKEKPLSISARAALVSNLTDWSWKARGGGYANTVSSAQFQDFAKRLKEANQAFVEATKLATQCPHLYVGAQTVALGQNWSKPKYDDLVAQANKKFPTYYQFYFGKSYYLQPRWNGEQNEWVQYAAKAADAIGGADGAKLYARIVWNVDNYGFYPDIFGEFSELKWDKVKSGFEALSKEYPGNRTVTSEFCKLAWCAKDQKTATSLMTNLGNHCDISVWKKKARFLQAQQELIPQRKNDDSSKHPD